MDILEEIDETIKDKKGKWNYTPMREKNETDALIDQLLQEFSSESGEEIFSAPSESYDYAGYNTKTETEERQEYEKLVSQQNYPSEKSVENTNNSPKSNVDMTQIFSREDIANYEVENSPNNAGYGRYREYNGSANDNYSGNGGFDDDYYDENDFEKDCGKLSAEELDLNDEEYAELENFIDSRGGKKILPKIESTSTFKKIWRMVSTALVTAFTIIGIFSSGLYLFEKFEESTTADKEAEKLLKENLLQVIYPLVGTQTDDFEKVEDISNEQMISLSIWEVIINGNVSGYRSSEGDGLVIPHEQIEIEVKKLFGIETEIEPTDIEVAGIEIKYDKDTESYILPENYNIYTLYPVVKKVTEQDGIYTVTAECFDDSPSWTDKKKKMPTETMVFTIKKTEDYYNILSAYTVE